MKRLFIFIAAIIAATTTFGQTPLPNDPAVRVGKLDNGMTYYIRHNEQPAQRAEFYLATDVGAFQETDDQDGLAHFLEHMCFNGTKNFPGKTLLNWLQSIGAEFGRNINASTGFEQTQYMLNNIPIVRESIIDSCLLIMHDYSHFVTCNPEEIDAERGVILEERRTRRDAGWRMFEKSLPYYYGDTPYARRTLIGGEEQLKTFAYESLTNFYHTWYRPDMQALIVVGDVDVDQIESKIKSIFSDIPAPEVPTQKVLHKIADNVEPVIGIITDPEAQTSSIEVVWKSEPMPKELMNTDLAYITELMKGYIGTIMRERFNDITAQPDAPFLSGSLYIGNLCYSCDATFGTVRFKDGESINAFTAFMTEIEKMKRYGFTEGEVQRAKENIISAYEKAAEAAATRKNAELVRPLINNFYKNEPFLDPQMELSLVQQICNQVISAPVLNQVAAQVITDENMIVLFNGPEKEGLANPTKEELASVLTAVRNAEIEAKAEETVNEPLISGDLKGSKVKKEKKTIYGATEWTLKNGVKVVVLPTEHKKDQVLFTLSLDGGKSLIATEDMPSFEQNIWSVYLSNSGVSRFSGTQLPKMLAGKNVSVMPYIVEDRHGLQGQCTPKDIETALQLAYLMFTDPRFDEDEYQAGIQQLKAIIPNITSNPDYLFQIELSKTLYDNDPRAVQLSEEILSKANLATIEKVYRELFKDASGALVRIVGNVDLETLKPMVEKYFGSLPKGKVADEVNKDNLLSFAKGEINKTIEIPMQTPKSTVFQLYSAYMPVDSKTEVALEVANYILDMIYTKTIREEEGGTYGVGTAMVADKSPVERAIIQIAFDTNPEQAEKLTELAVKGLKELAENGPEEDKFNMAIENLKKNIPESRISNSYWTGNIRDFYKYGEDNDAEYEAAVNSVTIEDVKNVLQAVLAQNNMIQVTSVPKN
ncbi:MAG: insulinase family protein [Bacteroidales bacterium]|nr:insulinase family protein [Bacteroidales bacterium]